MKTRDLEIVGCAMAGEDRTRGKAFRRCMPGSYIHCVQTVTRAPSTLQSIRLMSFPRAKHDEVVASNAPQSSSAFWTELGTVCLLLHS